ncbi:MAG: hypothetical protein KF729_26125 [Sandaracinaceae bacterium]|nr:hypothetical protein [Sandaracinaceae bacterium]
MRGSTTERGREAEATRPVRTVFLRRGEATTLHHHSERAAWTHVVAGEMIDERWHRGPDGELVHERRVLRAAQALAAPADSLHRVRALSDAAFVTTCAEDCGCAAPAGAHAARAAQHARAQSTARVTAVGAPSPRG